jgi:ubiquinone/menaquinone biosynthesis C-methylase UbiE
LYDRIGRLQDTQGPFERPALDRLIGHGQFDTATSVFELGCGTGTLAQHLLSEHLPSRCTYLGADVSRRMVAFTRARLESFGPRATVVRTDGTFPLPAPDGCADRFIPAYVFDLLERDYAFEVLKEAHRILRSGGLACLTSLTNGSSTLSRLVSQGWRAVWRRDPRLVGGCRPIRLQPFFDSEDWDGQMDVIVQSWGVPSQVVVAKAR